MPTITLNKKVLEQLVGKKLSLEELKDRISMLGTDLEKIENEEIVVEIFPNRPDLFSEQGLARALASFIGVNNKTGLKKYHLKKSGEKVIIDKSVQDVRPYTTCAIVKNLQFDDEKIREIIQIQEKLHLTFGRNRKKVAIGIYPLEKITFPVYFKADKPNNIIFRPLEAERQMTALQMLSQHKAGREYGHLLEGLDKFPFFIDAKNEILSLPPIINSHLTGKITGETKAVFIECSGFDYPSLSLCLNMIVTALADMGGEIYSLELVYPNHKKLSPDLIPGKMKLNLKYVNQRLGLNLKEAEVKKLLERMGYGCQKGIVLIPAYRADILHPVDLVEDIAIAYGYENFTAEIPNVATIGEETPFEKFSSKIREILSGLGLLEVKNYSLLTEKELNQKMLLKEKLIPLKNALGDYNHLRNSLLSSLLKNLGENQHNEYPQNIFEIGRIFNFALDSFVQEETGISEQENLAIMLCHEKADFTEIKQILDSLFLALGLKYTIREVAHPSFILGRVGDILIESRKIGVIGEIHPQVLTNWSLSMPVVGLELELEELFKFLRNIKE
jgi:phenylalanyl-tRNA synthetase beta chain